MKHTKLPSMSARKRRIMLLQMFFGLLLAVTVLAPVLWMFLTSVMRSVDLTAKPLQLIPKTFTFERFRQIFASETTSDPAYVFRICLRWVQYERDGIISDLLLIADSKIQIDILRLFN